MEMYALSYLTQGKFRGKTGLVPSNYLDIIEPLPADDDEDESSEVREREREERDFCSGNNRHVLLPIMILILLTWNSSN